MIKAYAACKAGAELKPFEYDPGVLGNQEVEIAVEYCGICHSDLSMLDNAWGITQYPLVLGHEVIGTISAIGKNVVSVQAGDRVGLGWHCGYCMHCITCLSGDQNLCASAQGTIVSHHGGFADKVRADATSVIKIPQGIDLQSAGPLLCGGITVFNPLLQFDVKPTDKVAVIGIGGLGHLALQFLNAWGCEVTAFTSNAHKKTEALKLGAHHAIDSHDSTALSSVAGQFDLIISTVNVKLDWGSYLAALQPKGRLHFVGVTLDALDIGAFPLISQQRSISGSPVGSPTAIVKMLNFAARHKIKPLIENYRFNQINEAVARLRSGEARYRVVLSH